MRHGIACVLTSAAFIFGGAGSWSGPAALAATTDDAPHDAPNDAVALAQAAGKAASELRAISYTAISFAEGPLAANTPKRQANVTFVRADAGGWMMHVVGHWRSVDAQGKEGPKMPLRVGSDGATAWAEKETEKVVETRGVEKTEQLREFAKGQSVDPLVVWEVVGDAPMTFEGATITSEGKGEADATPCTILRVVGSKDGEGTLRIFLADSDKLPRRIERILDAAPKSEKGGETAEKNVRVLTLSGVKTNASVAAMPFALSAPEGYRIRALGAEKKKLADSDKPQPGGGQAGKGKHKTERGMLEAGAKCPDFSLQDPSGKEWTLESFKGKVLVVDFWGTWCPPCRAAMPGMQALHEKYKGKPVAVVGFNFERDKKADPAKYMKDNNFTYQLLLKAEKLTSDFRVGGFPTFYVVSPTGEILWGAMGHAPAHTKQMEEIIDEQLGLIGKS